MIWTDEETNILIIHRDKGSSMGKIRKNLKDAGFVRTSEAISRKLRRIRDQEEGNIDNLLEDPVEWEFHSHVKKEKWYTGASLPLCKGDTKFVMLNDVHVPHNINLDSVFEFLNADIPHYLLLVGDILNMDPFSHWDKKKPSKFKLLPQPKKYYEECNELFYRPLREAVGNSCKIIHWIGNHEFWAQRAVEEMPEGEGYWEAWHNVEEIDGWIGSKGMANLGHLYFTHGDIINAGRNHASRMMNLYRRNVRYGHFHNIEESSQQDPIDQEQRHTARCCGTLEKHNPPFMQNRPHNWIHAVTYGTVESDGVFHDDTAVITNNRFMANGKIYGR